MEINNPSNQDRIAVVVVGYNRLKSIKRLLSSLLKANYPSNNIPLVISIDCSGDENLYDFVRSFEWPFGDKYLIIHEKRLGLKDHIFSCGDLTQYFKAIILLEDDLYVSPEFYNYTIATVEEYNNDDNIAGISLYSHEFNGFAGYPFTPLNDGSDTFAVQTVVSWGQCWSSKMWNSFRNWLNEDDVNFDKYDMPHRIKMWERAWSKYYYAYILENNKFFVFPYVALSTNFGDAGEHGNGSNANYQVSTLYGSKKYNLKDFKNMIKYDVYFNNIMLHQKLDLAKDDLCIDLYGNNNNINNKRYWLSVQNLPYKIIKQFGMSLRPIELNVINDIKGGHIYLYDIKYKTSHFRIKKKWTLLRYHLKAFNQRSLLRYSLYELSNAVRSKLKV